MSKKRSGTAEVIREEVIYTHEDVDQVKIIPLSVDWTYEESEYGDGSTDYDFETEAYDPDGNLVELTQDEIDTLYEKLKNWGEFD